MTASLQVKLSITILTQLDPENNINSSHICVDKHKRTYVGRIALTRLARQTI